MNVTNSIEPQKPATANGSGEDKIRELVRGEAAKVSSRNAESEANAITPAFKKIGAASIAGIENLIRELEEARSFLKAEGERIQREAADYANLTETADASVKIILESVHEWRTAGQAAKSKAA